ncbi:MAG TPA: GNAT family N-acetyltransferase [Gaiellaceae bacterium]|nr:GNAT family N-acetyltransferase [Gaiellaceae bacterium]
MAGLEVVPFSDEHLDAAAALLAARHARHREAEPLLPELQDPRAAIEREWRAEGASGVFATRDGAPVAYLVASRYRVPRAADWMRANLAGLAIDGDREAMRDLYAAAAQRWVDDGLTQHVAFVPTHDAELVDAWFRLSFGASSYLALRATGPEEPFDAGVEIRPGTPDDFGEAARLELEMAGAMVPSPSFSGVGLQSYDEVLAEWHQEDNDDFVLFVGERDGRVVGHVLLYRRPPDLRVPENSIDLAQASTEPAARGTGVGRALTAHVVRWAHENRYPVMTTDWRMTNLWASRFWPKRGFRPAFLRLYRSIP